MQLNTLQVVYSVVAVSVQAVVEVAKIPVRPFVETLVNQPVLLSMPTLLDNTSVY